MSLPETCPFCGSGGEFKNPEKWVGFTCMTTIHTAQDARRMQSMTCAGLERTRLLSRVAELEARCKRLEEALDTLTLVVGLTPIAGNKEALQEALDLARAELKSKEAKP